jgi:hypothetical protein
VNRLLGPPLSPSSAVPVLRTKCNASDAESHDCVANASLVLLLRVRFTREFRGLGEDVSAEEVAAPFGEIARNLLMVAGCFRASLEK